MSCAPVLDAFRRVRSWKVNAYAAFRSSPLSFTTLESPSAAFREGLKRKTEPRSRSESFEAENLADGETAACSYADFHNDFGFFLPLAGITTVRQIRENAFDIEATGRLNRLYVELLTENPEWDTAARRQDLNHFFARLIFCFFAEDTNIFHGKNLFTATIEQMSARLVQHPRGALRGVPRHGHELSRNP